MKCKLNLLKQIMSTSIYIAEFWRIMLILNWSNNMLKAAYYQKFKEEIKDEIIKNNWSNNLNEMTEIAVKIDNQ